MRTIISLIVFALISCNGQNRTSNENGNKAKESLTSESAAQDYFLGIFSENMSISAPVGHAFIGIGKGTPMTCDINGNTTEVWGFYPKVRIMGGKSIWFGHVDSEIKSDVMTKIDRQAFIKIDFADYIKVQLRIEEWKKKQYELTRNDCISFLIDICNTIPNRLIVPKRETTDTPDSYVRKLINLNK